MKRFLTLLGCAVILWLLTTQLNHALTDLQVYVFTGALFVTFNALTQPFAAGIAVSACIGLVFDANTPVAFGTHLVLFVLTHLLVARFRERVPRNDTLSRTIVAILANLALFLVFSFTQLSRFPSPGSVWPRLLVDLLCSQVLIALIAPWYYSLQARALAVTGSERSYS